jgi:hypothetical protein
MPRSLRDYSRHDWARLRPVTQTYKTLRYDAVNALYMRRGRVDASLAARLRGRGIVCSIAFNNDWAIDRQSRLMRRYLVGADYLVADNSGDDAAAARIAALCAAHGAHYLRLPRSPTRGASRSHGLALNWVCRNLIAPLEPPAFGFVDHDIFPTAPVDVAALLREQPVYGRLVERFGRWYLWAGFCFFRGAVLRERKLDFRQDWFLGLDTGGANWRFYAALDRAALAFPRERQIHAGPGGDGMADAIDLIGDWIHCGNASGWRQGAAGKHAIVDKMLAPYLAEASTIARRS